MILGITLSHYQRLLLKGENYKGNFWINKLLLKQSKKQFQTIDIASMKFGDFVTLENSIVNADFKTFCSIFVVKYFWQIVYVHNLKLIIEDYRNQKEEIFKNYQYIFDPPHYGEIQKETIGSELRKDFVKEFGNYVILTDLICKGQLVNYKKIEKWKLDEFLFWANYLSGQKIIENVQ
ncbi:hypothetical protein [Flavobacterium sp.]|uniref:hypothetical protein n=1 Tax=Flavobacterium sp. TaxID=239 RepID=UPI0038FC34B9